MPWYFYVLEFLSGAFLANGVPHFVHGISGGRFQSPFAKPPGVGESSPVVNVVWGFANFVGGTLLLYYFFPDGSNAVVGWVLLALGALAMAVQLALHFGKVRGGRI